MTDRVLDALRVATDRLCDALVACPDLDTPSLLPDWSRLTIACHLRYGAESVLRMTIDTLAGRPASYYPLGRATQRDGTLSPRGPDDDVVTSLRTTSTALDELWSSVGDWTVVVREPPDNPDLGDVPLRRLLLSRLTEVEVHGTDLDLGLGPWSDVFVAEVLPMRLEWLNVRRSNHRTVDTSIHASWLLVATDRDLAWRIDVAGTQVRSQPSNDASGATVIERPGADLLGMLLGRVEPPPGFRAAFPGP